MYCSDANSTAFQFPLHDGKLLQTKAGPAVEVPLVRSAAQRSAAPPGRAPACCACARGYCSEAEWA